MEIKVIICKVGEQPEVIEIDSSLEAAQAVVGGLIECLQMNGSLSSGVDLWCNEEGLFTCEPNRLVMPAHGHSTPIHGAFFLARHDSEGDTISLTDADVEEWIPVMESTPVGIIGL